MASTESRSGARTNRRTRQRGSSRGRTTARRPRRTSSSTRWRHSRGSPTPASSTCIRGTRASMRPTIRTGPSSTSTRSSRRRSRTSSTSRSSSRRPSTTTAMHGVVKTSGQTGLQIYVPVRRGPDYSAVRHWVEEVGRAIDQAAPGRVSWEWAVAKRTGRIRIDYTQNIINKTLAAPYSLRPAPGAPVSTPDRVGGARRPGPAARSLEHRHDRRARRRARRSLRSGAAGGPGPAPTRRVMRMNRLHAGTLRAMRRSLILDRARCATSVLAACGSSTTAPSGDAGGDDATADAGPTPTATPAPTPTPTATPPIPCMPGQFEIAILNSRAPPAPSTRPSRFATRRRATAPRTGTRSCRCWVTAEASAQHQSDATTTRWRLHRPGRPPAGHGAARSSRRVRARLFPRLVDRRDVLRGAGRVAEVLAGHPADIRVPDRRHRHRPTAWSAAARSRSARSSPRRTPDRRRSVSAPVPNRIRPWQCCCSTPRCSRST